MKTVMMVAFLLLGILVFTQSYADSSTHEGEGTYYGYGGGGNCSFPVPADYYTAAMNGTDYDGSAACGGLIEVTNTDTGLTVTVRIDDQCPGCAEGDVDLDESAFEQIAELETGRIPITWKYVANDQAGNIKLYFKDGSSQWWTAVQVRDHKYPISSVEYRVTSSGDDYIELPREDYNYFVGNSGFGVGPYDFRITDFWGQTVEVEAISLAVTTEIDTGTQFPDYDSSADDSSDDSNSDDSSDDSDDDSNSDDSSDDSDDNSNSDDSSDDSDDGDLDVSESVSTSWGDGYCETVIVTNSTSDDITWTVTLEIAGTVYTLWNAEWSQSDTTLTASGVSWNATLMSGESTEFGFCANY